MSDHYQEQREKEHFVNKSLTLYSEKDLWQTPIDIFHSLDDEFCFSADICASRENALCDKFFTKEDNALERRWGSRGNAVFCNPPYSLVDAFINEAMSQSFNFNLTVVMLVNANTDKAWFAQAAE